MNLNHLFWYCIIMGCLTSVAGGHFSQINYVASVFFFVASVLYIGVAFLTADIIKRVVDKKGKGGSDE